MPRVIMKTKNRAGKARNCGKCSRPILPGEKYRSWSFRYGGTYFRCFRPECAPKRSELTQSLMGEVYAAIEVAEVELPTAETVPDIVTIVEAVAESAEEVKDQYEQAAEPFGGQGENQERADELDGWISELQNYSPEEPDEEEDSDEEQAEKLENARTEAEELLNGCPL